jgi:hypothetical protein
MPRRWRPVARISRCWNRGRIWRVPVADVLYLRAELRYVTARTREREYLLDESLMKLEEEFADGIPAHPSQLPGGACASGRFSAPGRRG